METIKYKLTALYCNMIYDYYCQPCNFTWKSKALSRAKCLNCGVISTEILSNIKENNDSKTENQTQPQFLEKKIKIINTTQEQYQCGNCNSLHKKTYVKKDDYNCPLCGEVLLWFFKFIIVSISLLFYFFFL